MTWLRWIYICHFGRRCARIRAEAMAGQPPTPPGLMLMLEWRCEGCGHTYRRKQAIS
jgi:hypothetical protein